MDRLAVALLVLSLGGWASAAEQEPSLKQLARGAFRIGAALNLAEIEGRDARALEIVTRQFDSVSPENVLKWAVVHPCV